MKRMTIVSRVMASAFLLLVSRAASAAPPTTTPSTWTGGAAFLGAQPLGDFSDSSGFGAGATATATLWRKATPLGLRFEFGGVVYGSRKLRQTVRSAPNGYPLERTADNWFATVQVGPELAKRSGPVRPYAFATAGASYFATSFETSTDLGMPVESVVTYDSWTFAARGGVGVQVPVGRSTTLDLGARYLYNSEVKYLAEGDLGVVEKGEIVVGHPRQSSVQLFEFVVGIRFDF